METFFLTTGNFFCDSLVRIACSFVAGFVFGLERRYRQQMLGMRTLILICTSSCLLMIVSIAVAQFSTIKADGARIAAQVVSGIGFLGGGTILRQGMNVKGLTSAAIIWTVAALGLAIGCGLILIAFLAQAVCLFGLVFLNKVEHKYFATERTRLIKLTFNSFDIHFDALSETIKACGFVICDIGFEKDMSQGTICVTVSVKEQQSTSIALLIKKLESDGGLLAFSYEN